MKKLTILKLVILITLLMGIGQSFANSDVLLAQSDDSIDQSSDSDEGLIIEDDEAEIAPMPASSDDSELDD